jgi:tetrahydromethanopterin S-methyltransferase subunit G
MSDNDTLTKAIKAKKDLKSLESRLSEEQRRLLSEKDSYLIRVGKRKCEILSKEIKRLKEVIEKLSE